MRVPTNLDTMHTHSETFGARVERTAESRQSLLAGVHLQFDFQDLKPHLAYCRPTMNGD